MTGLLVVTQQPQPPGPPWATEIETLTSLLGWTEGVIAALTLQHGEAKARELLEAALLEAENRRAGKRLLTARYIAELRPR